MTPRIAQFRIQITACQDLLIQRAEVKREQVDVQVHSSILQPLFSRWLCHRTHYQSSHSRHTDIGSTKWMNQFTDRTEHHIVHPLNPRILQGAYLVERAPSIPPRMARFCRWFLGRLPRSCRRLPLECLPQELKADVGFLDLSTFGLQTDKQTNFTKWEPHLKYDVVGSFLHWKIITTVGTCQ